MLVAHALGPRPGESVLDLCASPGAKTTHIAALMGDEGRVVAVDADPDRAGAIEANCGRLGVTCVDVRVGDAAAGGFDGGYDRVLVDPPCSDLGTLRSRPDARWRKTPEGVAEVAALQARILDVAADSLREGGRLVYSTCTVSERENERQIEDFLARHADFTPIDLSAPYPALRWKGSGFLQSLPHRHDTDGFFVAALARRPAKA
jgi:16S rRNA (cytosine967-C5)-methyltransferase